MSRRRVSMAEWIRQSLSDPNLVTENSKCTMISLVLVVAAGSGISAQDIYQYRFGGPANEPEKLEEMFMGMADTHIQDMPPGVYTFNLWAYYGSSMIERRFPFVRNTVGTENGPALATENPDERGAKAQGMRQHEMVFLQTYKKQEHLDVMCLRLVETLGNQLQRAREQEDEARQVALEAMQRMMLQNNEHEARMAERQRVDLMIREGAKLAPPIINTITGQETFPQSTADTAILRMIAEKVKSDQVMMVLQTLGVDDQSRALVANRLNEFEKEREADEKKMALLHPKITSDPIADARGELRLVEGGKKEGG